MLVDLPHEAVVQYQASLELLDAIGDAFWVGGMFNIKNIVWQNVTCSQRSKEISTKLKVSGV